MLKLLSEKQLKQVTLDLAVGSNIEAYRNHTHPDIRAVVAGTKYATRTMIFDPSPEVRLALIQQHLWIEKIAVNERNTKLILAIIESGHVERAWLTHESKIVRKAIERSGLLWKRCYLKR